VSPDPLKEIFRAALAESASAGDVDRFVEAFRARAELVLGERLARLEEQLRALEQELGWRRAALTALGDEHERLKGEAQELRRERQAAAEAHDRLRQETEDLRNERSAASLAHDRLLAHHKDVLTRIAEELERLAASLPAGAAAEQLRAQAAALRREIR
jgi:chromosome segregation ATPase